jgi:hypothetical protein
MDYKSQTSFRENASLRPPHHQLVRTPGDVPPATPSSIPATSGSWGDEKQLACPVEGPWPQKVVLLTLTDALPHEPRKEMPRESALPWAVELGNGKRCSLFTGATAPVAGMRINYGCPGGFQVVGDIDRSGPAWRVFFQAENAIALEQVDVAIAWY